MATETPSSSSPPPPPPPPPPRHQFRCNKCNKHLSPESLSGQDQAQAQAQAQPNLICLDCHFHVLSLLTSQFIPFPIPDTETETETDNSIPEHLRQQQRRDTIRFHLRQFLTRPRPQFGKPPSPASKQAVQGLKTFDFSGGDNSEDCAICRDVVRLNDVVKEMPCGHSYHSDCILTWLSATNSCPICRFQLPTQVENSSSVRSSETENSSSVRDSDVVRSSDTENLPSV